MNQVVLIVSVMCVLDSTLVSVARLGLFGEIYDIQEFCKVCKHLLFVILLQRSPRCVFVCACACFKALEVGKSRMGFRLYCRAGAPRDSRSYRPRDRFVGF